MPNVTEYYTHIAHASAKTLRVGKNYKHNTSAEALLFHTASTDKKTVTKGLRLEAPFIGKEFTDGVPIGKDPAGILYYYALDDLEHGREVTYKIESKTHDGKKYIWIGFYGESEGNYHAEFVARDYTEAVKAMDLDGYSHKGKWEDLSICSAAAIVDKRTDTTKIKLSAKGIVKSANIPDTDTDTRSKVPGQFNVKGVLWFKHIQDINKGHNASYNNDRIVFTKASYHDPTDFTAYFIPYKTDDASNSQNLHVANTSTFTFTNVVTWYDKESPPN